MCLVFVISHDPDLTITAIRPLLSSSLRGISGSKRITNIDPVIIRDENIEERQEVTGPVNWLLIG